MKNLSASAIVILAGIFIAGCGSRTSADEKSGAAADSLNVPDSVVRYFSQQRLLKEVTFRNGIRNGLTKTYYPGGQLYQTFWYVNDLREDSSGWYYTEGQLFRSTPYRRDTIDGIVKQYYRTGEIRARIGYSKGLRTTLFEEYSRDGKLVKNYPEIVVAANDQYSASGRYILNLALSDNGTRVKFFRGEFTNGLYDTAFIKPIITVDGKAGLVLKKTGKPGNGYLNIIGEITTNFGNKYIASKKVELPYNDLN
jgi:hypothetical protein